MVAWLLLAACCTVACLLFGWLRTRGRLAESRQSHSHHAAAAVNSRDSAVAAVSQVRRQAGRAGHRVDVTRKLSSGQQQTAVEGRGGTGDVSHSTHRSDSRLIRHLKGHSEHCTALAFGTVTHSAAASHQSNNSATASTATSGRHLLAVASRDRLVRVWYLADDADSGHSASDVVSVKLRNDFATAICFGQSDSVLMCVLDDSTVEVYDIATDGRLTATFNRSFPIACKDVISTARCTNNRLLLVMSRGMDTSIFAYTTSGVLVRSVAINQLRNNDMACTTDGLFFAAATKLSDVKVWRVSSDRAGGVTGIEHCMTLTGHTKAVQSICFPTNAAVCTITADGTLRCFNIGVRYQDGEQAKLRWTSDTQLAGDPIALRCSSPASYDPTASSSSSLTWLLLAASAKEVRVYRASATGCELLYVMSDVGGQWGLTAVELSTDGKRMVTANSGSKVADYWRVADG